MLNKVQKIIPKVYQVGGSVRDELLNRIPKDYDFTTPMLPDEIEQAVRDAKKRPYLMGKQFGTIGFKVDGEMVEVTSFRQEQYFEGSRKPKVEFVKDITADLSRRDFTINAIAKSDHYIDPFGGRIDIIAKVIKCVGKPKARFKEDPLRILRGARFASQLGFTINDLTLSYMKKMAPSLLIVSKERWSQELDKLLMGDYVIKGLDYLMESRVFNFVIPELSLQYNYDQNSPWHRYDLWEHTKRVVANCPKDLNLRWAALLHDISKPFTRTENKNGHSNYIDHAQLSAEMVVRLGRYLKRSNEWTKVVKELVLNHLDESSPLKVPDNLSK